MTAFFPIILSRVNTYCQLLVNSVGRVENESKVKKKQETTPSLPLSFSVGVLANLVLGAVLERSTLPLLEELHAPSAVGRDGLLESVGESPDIAHEPC